jgi:hypothetical protein
MLARPVYEGLFEEGEEVVEARSICGRCALLAV